MSEQFQREEELLERVEIVVDYLFDLLALKQYGEVSQKQFKLFLKANAIKQQITAQIQKSKPSKQESIIKTIQDNKDQLNEFKQTKEIQKIFLQKDKQRQTQLIKLIQTLYVATCQIKYMESLIRSNIILKKQINQLRQIFSQMQQQLELARQNNHQIAIQESDTITKNVLEEFLDNMKEKKQEKQHFEQENRKIKIQYNNLMDYYKDILNERNEEKIMDIRNNLIFADNYEEARDSRIQINKREPKVSDGISNQMLNIKVIPQQSNLRIEQIATMVLLLATVFIVISVGFK